MMTKRRVILFIVLPIFLLGTFFFVKSYIKSFFVIKNLSLKDGVIFAESIIIKPAGIELKDVSGSFKRKFLTFNFAKLSIGTLRILPSEEKTPPNFDYSLPTTNFNVSTYLNYVNIEDLSLRFLDLPDQQPIPLDINGSIHDGTLKISSKYVNDISKSELIIKNDKNLFCIEQPSKKERFCLDMSQPSLSGNLSFSNLTYNDIQLKDLSLKAISEKTNIDTKFHLKDRVIPIKADLILSNKNQSIKLAITAEEGELNCQPINLKNVLEAKCFLQTHNKSFAYQNRKLEIPSIKLDIKSENKNNIPLITFKSPKNENYSIEGYFLADTKKPDLKISLDIPDFSKLVVDESYRGSMKLNYNHQEKKLEASVHNLDLIIVKVLSLEGTSKQTGNVLNINLSASKIHAIAHEFESFLLNGKLNLESNELVATAKLPPYLETNEITISDQKISGYVTLNKVNVEDFVNNGTVNFYKPSVTAKIKLLGTKKAPKALIDGKITSEQFNYINLKSEFKESEIILNISGPNLNGRVVQKDTQFIGNLSFQNFPFPNGSADLSSKFKINVGEPLSVQLDTLQAKTQTGNYLIEIDSKGPLIFENYTLKSIDLHYSVNNASKGDLVCHSNPCKMDINLSDFIILTPQLDVLKGHLSLLFDKGKISVRNRDLPTSKDIISVKNKSYPQQINISSLDASYDFFNKSGSVNSLMDFGTGSAKVAAEIKDDIFHGAVELNQAQALLYDGITGTISGNLAFNSNEVMGDLYFDPLTVSINFLKSEQKLYDKSPYHPDNQKTDKPESKFKIKINLTSREDTGFAVKAPGINIEGDFDLNIGGTLTQPVITGDLDIDHGTVQQLNAKFNMEPSSIKFQNTSALNPDPDLDLNLTTIVSNYDIRVKVLGRKSNPMVNFTSSPPSTRENILYLLTTGTPAPTGAESGLAGVVSAASGYADNNLWFIQRFKDSGIQWGINSKEVNVNQKLEYAPLIYFYVPLDVFVPRWTDNVKFTYDTVLKSFADPSQINYKFQFPEYQFTRRLKGSLYYEYERDPFYGSELKGAGAGFLFGDSFP